MEWTHFHGPLLTRAVEIVLGKPETGAMAFVRCLNPDVVSRLASDDTFVPESWRVSRVAGENDDCPRTITSDIAVAKREAKEDAILLLVDTERAGAGMDGIYSASREVDEVTLFHEAQRLAASEIRRQLSAAHRSYAETAIKKARGHGGVYAVSRWAEFSFLCHVLADKNSVGAHLHRIGLWPILDAEAANPVDHLEASRMFVERLLGVASASLPPATRIDTVRLDRESEGESEDLERFLHEAGTKPLLTALSTLAERRPLWIGALRTEGNATSLQSIELTSWRNRNGNIAKWSGLIDEPKPDLLGREDGATSPPNLILPRDTDSSDFRPTLEIRWKTDPAVIEKNSLEYRITILTDNDEELASKTLVHTARKGGEKCRFGADDFTLSEDALLSAKVVLSVPGQDGLKAEPSEEFRIRYGEPPEREASGAATRVRTFSEGLAELESRQAVTEIVSDLTVKTDDSKNFVSLRTPLTKGRRKSFRVSRPCLLAEIEEKWGQRRGEIGRWVVKVRSSGSPAGTPELLPLDVNVYPDWERVTTASRRLADHFRATGGGVSQVYDDQAAPFENVVREYLRAWAAVLETGDPILAIANTVEVQSLSGRTIGLIVLPSHPLRIAWHAAYDNLVLHTAFEQRQKPNSIREELACLDGAMFPEFLPRHPSGTFVFADTLGFHAVGMVPDDDKEPKAAVALMARALEDSESAESAPTVGSQSAEVLGNEILKYLECHDTSRLLHIHALRAGDGLTVARSLGCVNAQYRATNDGEQDTDESTTVSPFFSLEIYPSEEQRSIAGRFIADTRDKRRSSGTGMVTDKDRWMLESVSLPGGVNMPRLRWARKEQSDPDTAAHLAIAFDTFESRVVAEQRTEAEAVSPRHAFGLMSFYQRRYSSQPSPQWLSVAPTATRGERHPGRQTHTDMLERLHGAVRRTVACHLCAETTSQVPVLKTEISRNKAKNLQALHRLCDWVITLDRNAGIEYFDSPMENPEVYDAYVIDCVPEREDLGCLQLITSTANLQEVRDLFGNTLDEMGLSHSPRNAEFLLGHLKALSGRLAIRLTGNKHATSELIALALSHASCAHAGLDDDCWPSLEEGFVVPVDDVRDLLPPLSGANDNAQDDGKGSRPDLIYVSAAARQGLTFRFVEVKYRRHLRAARSSEILERINKQVLTLRERWTSWYDHNDVCATFRAIRRAKLARVLRFYAEKARRHHLPEMRFRELAAEIDRMIERGGDYALPAIFGADRGWVFCPEYAGHQPLKISPDDWNTRVFLFGPALLHESGPGSASVAGDETDPATTGYTSEPIAKPPEEQQRHRVVSETSNADQFPTTLPRSASAPYGPGDSTPAVRLGTDAFTNADVHWPMTISGNPHLLIAGLPGMGKTTCLLNMCKQMVAANIRPIVFSYHQDIDERLAESVASVRFIDFDGLGFNPLQITDRTSRMAHLDVAGAVRDIFNAIYNLGDIQGASIRTAIKDSFIEAGWGDSVQPDTPEPEFRRFLEILREKSKPDLGLRTLLARLGELDDYGFFTLRESRTSLWESEQPTVIRIHTTQNDNLQRAFASWYSMVFTRRCFGGESKIASPMRSSSMKHIGLGD